MKKTIYIFILPYDKNFLNVALNFILHNKIIPRAKSPGNY